MKTRSELKASAKDYFWGFVEDDYTQLGYLTGYIMDCAPHLSTVKVISLTKEIIEELIEEKDIYVVSAITEGRVEMSHSQIMAEIDNTFSETFGRPDIGEGIWFGVDSFLK